MILVRIRIPILALLYVIATAATAAAQIPGWMQKSFSLDRIDADNFHLMREVEIEGEPGSSNAGQKFFADDLQLNIRSGELSAIGNVVFQTPTTRISADKVVFNTKTHLGTFHGAFGIAQLGERGQRNLSMFGGLEPDVYFYGQTIEKIGVDKYKITKGGFTTCVQPTPRWEIVSDTATMRLDHYVMLKNAVVEVKDVPVFYLPILYYPIQKDDRATGVLLPMYGSSLAQGSTISNAFFWAINRSQDATVFHDWMFSRGNGVGAEYRYLFGPQAQGDFRYYLLDEKAALINDRLRDARRSKTIRGGMSQNLPFHLSARGRIDYFTNVTVQQTYNHDFYNASNSNRSYQGGVSGSWHSLSLNGTFMRNEYFQNETTSTVNGQAPGFSGVLSGVRLGRLPLFATANAEAARLIFIQNFGQTTLDSSLNKIDITPSIRAPLSTLPYLQVNATATYRTTYYSESLASDRRTQIEDPVTRSYGDMRVDIIGPVLSRVFTPNNAMADRLKHIIEPSFSVQRRTEIPNQDRIPVATGYDIIIGGVTQMSYGLTNRIMVRKEKPDQPKSGAPRELLSVQLRQTYYTDAAASKFDTTYSYGYNNRVNAFSPIAMTARATPTDPLAIDYRLEYDPKALPNNPKLLGMSLNGTLRASDINFTGGWSRQAFALTSATGAVTPTSNLVRATTDFRLKRSSFGGVVDYNYDISRSTLINQRYVGFYNAQCCGVSFEYQSFHFPTGTNFIVPHDHRFNMSFTLAGVGSFSNFFGAFGGSQR